MQKIVHFVLFCANFCIKAPFFSFFANFLQKFCKFGPKKVIIARFRRNLGPFQRTPELVPGFLPCVALVPIPAAFPGGRLTSEPSRCSGSSRARFEP
jgi:hypothetical protein